MGTSPKSSMNGKAKDIPKSKSPKDPPKSKSPKDTPKSKSPKDTPKSKSPKIKNQKNSSVPTAPSKSSPSSSLAVWMQILAVATYNMSALGMGVGLGFMGMCLPQVREDASMKVTEEEVSWIASIGALGGIAGSLIGIAVEDYLGRRGTFLLGTIPAALGQWTAATSSSATSMCIGMFMNGIGGTLLASSAQVYLPEICEPKRRGLFLAAGGIFFTGGNLIGYALGAVYPWRTVLLCSTIPFILCAGSFFLPESPSWLASKGRRKDAEVALFKFRRNTGQVKEELRGIGQQPSGKSSGGRWSFIFTRESLHPVFIVWSLFLISTFSGLAPTMAYTKDIFSGGQIDNVTATLVTGVLQVILNFVTGFLVQRVGRRPLLVASGAGMSFSLLLFSFKDQLQFSWLPPVAIWLYLCFGVPGFQNIPWMLMGELFPLRTRGMLSCLTGCFFSMCMFSSIKTYPMMVAGIGVAQVFAIYSVIAVLGSVFAMVFVPETKDKSLSEIEAYFSSRKTSSKKKKN